MKLVFIFGLPSCSTDDSSLCLLVAIPIVHHIFRRRPCGRYWNLRYSYTCTIFHTVSERQITLHPVQAEWNSDLDFVSYIFDLSAGRITLSLFKSKRLMYVLFWKQCCKNGTFLLSRSVPVVYWESLLPAFKPKSLSFSACKTSPLQDKWAGSSLLYY